MVVALHPEGVDRNPRHERHKRHYGWVALHPEGVDRNRALRRYSRIVEGSPSTRRAWIEIDEAVTMLYALAESPSTRRAWIEIVLHAMGVPDL